MTTFLLWSLPACSAASLHARPVSDSCLAASVPSPVFLPQPGALNQRVGAHKIQRYLDAAAQVAHLRVRRKDVNK